MAVEHQPGCPLDPVHWLRHAVAAAGNLAQEEPEGGLDRVSAMSLTDALAYFAELDDWATVTLKDVARHANLMDSELNQERFKSACNCGAYDQPSS
ncbi:hypothetical protein [Streptomyces sp. NPDC059171]|uniref:hypothetical protein n=1 Tax=Streptomyces sp. NPDC059171 TaxID=3346755 RepID=UPI0036C277D9